MAPSCASPARRSRCSRSRPQARKSSPGLPGISATVTPRCKWWATRCASGAIACWKTCYAASARGSPRSRRRSTRSMALMDTRTTTTMSTKRSRRRTSRGTRVRRVVRDAALPPLVPARGTPRRSRRGDPVAGAQFTNVDKAVLDSRLRGNERSKRGAAKDAVMIADGGGFCDAVFFVHAHRAAAERNDEALRAVAELAAVFAPSQERHLETTAQGRAFLDATRAAWPTPALDRLLAVWDGAIALPVAVAVAGAGH